MKFMKQWLLSRFIKKTPAEKLAALYVDAIIHSPFSPHSRPAWSPEDHIWELPRGDA
jgi:hypothetical protein